MNDHTSDNPAPGSELPETPAELRSLESWLDEFGAEERSAAPESLEGHIFFASRAALGAGTQTPAVIARPRRQFGGPARLAAGFALLAGAGALTTWLVMSPAPSVQSEITASADAAVIEEEFETWLAAASVWDDVEVFVMLDVESDLEALSAEIANLWLSMDDPLLSEELF